MTAMGGEHVLIVEDDQRIGSTLLRAFRSSGYDARWEATARGALDAAADRRPDLVLLDLGLPDEDGLAVCRKMHEIDPTVDIVMLTARDEELDVVVGLDAGAVDYVTKPFRLAELLARVRAQLSQSTVGDLVIDTSARRVWLGGEEIVMRAKEFDLLSRLAEDAGNAVTREDLMCDVWDENWFGSTKTLDVHIGALRRKLGDDPAAPRYIETVRGVGFRFAER